MALRAATLSLFFTLLPWEPLHAQAWTPGQEAILYRFAPILVQEAHRDSARRAWDLPIRADFDGDRRGANNEESLRSGAFPLEAHAYAALIETETHWFLTYGFFHALDWSTLPACIPWTWHENDMESVQLVVRKGKDSAEPRVELAAIQAHLTTAFSAPPGSPVTGKRLSKTPLRLFSHDLGPGEHPVILSERGGHGLHALPKDFRLDTSARKHLYLFPSAGDPPGRFRADAWTYRYRLLPIRAHLWQPYLDGKEIGDGGLMDGRFDYSGERVAWKGIPRHFDSDRWCAPGKRDAGILPFAFSTSLGADDLGVLFFDPAIKYPRLFNPGGEWSRDYRYNPLMGP